MLRKYVYRMSSGDEVAIVQKGRPEETRLVLCNSFCVDTRRKLRDLVLEVEVEYQEDQNSGSFPDWQDFTLGEFVTVIYYSSKDTVEVYWCTARNDVLTHSRNRPCINAMQFVIYGYRKIR